MEERRGISDTWILNLESTASLLIALGGLGGALVGLGCLPGGPVWRWAEACFFPLQLPVFYFGFGYRYQRQWRVRSGRQWLRAMGYQAVYTMVPLIFVTLLTLLANGWMGAEPTLAPASFLRATLVDPVIPVGFFLVVLVMYALTPTLASGRQAAGVLAAAIALKALAVAGPALPAVSYAAWPYVAQGFCGSWVWFVAGMALAWQPEARTRRLFSLSPAACTMGWLILGVGLLACGAPASVREAVLTAAGLGWLAVLFGGRFADGDQVGFYRLVGGYTKAIWLLHPVFMRGLFHVLALAGVTAAGPGAVLFVPAHVFGGLAVVYVLPVGVLWAMNHVGKLGFLVNPDRYLAPHRGTVPYNTRVA